MRHPAASSLSGRRRDRGRRQGDSDELNITAAATAAVIVEKRNRV